MAEEWRDIAGFEDLYEVSSLGRVRNVCRGSILSERRNSDGYARVALSREGRYSHRLVHRLVAEAFIPNPESYPLVLHGPNGPLDNSVDNLRWGTNSDNMRDRRRDGTDRNASKTHCINKHAYTAENTYYNAEGHRSCLTCRHEHTCKSNERRRNSDR